MSVIIDNTITRIDKTSDSVTLTVKALGKLVGISAVDIHDKTGSVNAKPAKEGDVIVTVANRSDETLKVRKDGSLSVIGKDADQYYINNSGELCRKMNT